MKIFSWMQSKLNNGKQTTKKPANGISTTNRSLHEPRKEEFSDWPHALLAIGTFGNNDNNNNNNNININININVNDDDSIKSVVEENRSSSSDDQLDFTTEEVEKVQKELIKLLSRKATESQRRNGFTLPLDKFLNCPSSLEVDRTVSAKLSDDYEDKDEADFRRSINLVLGTKGKDLCMDGNNNAIKKKSLSFLLKKMFVCSSGFNPTPSLRNQIPESRMEKLLRAILNKKIIIPQNSNASTSARKYIENRLSTRTDTMEEQIEDRGNNSSKWVKTDTMEEQIEDRGNNSFKWVKTDSEYIVLEI